jgi:hypothetical protein
MWSLKIGCKRVWWTEMGDFMFSPTCSYVVAFLGCYAMYVGSLLPTFRNNMSVLRSKCATRHFDPRRWDLGKLQKVLIFEFPTKVVDVFWKNITMRTNSGTTAGRAAQIMYQAFRRRISSFVMPELQLAVLMHTERLQSLATHVYILFCLAFLGTPTAVHLSNQKSQDMPKLSQRLQTTDNKFYVVSGWLVYRAS